MEDKDSDIGSHFFLDKAWIMLLRARKEEPWYNGNEKDSECIHKHP